MATRNGSETMTAVASIGEVGARRGLVQHGQAGATHPQGLRGRRDLHREPGQHADGVTVSDARGSQSAGDAAGPLVHLEPGVPDGLVWLPGNHAPRALVSVAEHVLGKPAHDCLLGSGAIAQHLMLLLLKHTLG
jgi:hypothetical protein